uniref:Uncharacterized protein n=1 Tax=Populus alba TaxID=43335 RepID=A0A4U5QRF2_POPAL|nr:hypothetical protein D5086_0000073980 [Populus alba]
MRETSLVKSVMVHDDDDDDDDLDKQGVLSSSAEAIQYSFCMRCHPQSFSPEHHNGEDCQLQKCLGKVANQFALNPKKQRIKTPLLYERVSTRSLSPSKSIFHVMTIAHVHGGILRPLLTRGIFLSCDSSIALVKMESCKNALTSCEAVLVIWGLDVSVYFLRSCLSSIIACSSLLLERIPLLSGPIS